MINIFHIAALPAVFRCSTAPFHHSSIGMRGLQRSVPVVVKAPWQWFSLSLETLRWALKALSEAWESEKLKHKGYFDFWSQINIVLVHVIRICWLRLSLNGLREFHTDRRGGRGDTARLSDIANEAWKHINPSVVHSAWKPLSKSLCLCFACNCSPVWEKSPDFFSWVTKQKENARLISVSSKIKAVGVLMY